MIEAVSGGIGFTDDVSDEEYIKPVPPPKRVPFPRPAKEITLTRKKKYNSGAQRGGHKKRATYSDLCASV